MRSLMTLGKTAVVTFLLVGLFSEVASAQTFGRNKIQYKDHEWEILSTPHFDIHFYQGSEAFAIRAGLVLENGYEMLSYKLKEVLPWKVPVILYSSHNDFLQTNVTTSLLSEGVQAFAEPSRRRIVLPFTSSFKEFEHTAIHELAHVFTFHIVYNRLLDNVFSRNYLFSMPLWVAEGLAEYLAVGWDPDSDTFIRDAVIHDYLPPIDYLSGYYVYKGGQAVFNYIKDTYGHEKVLEILDALASTRSANIALERTIGLNSEELSEEWQKSLRKHYWPLYPDKTEAEDLGRKLTDHIDDHGYYNTKPVLSPDGEYIAFFSDRDGLIGIHVISALDGKEIRNLVTGSRSNRFESLHFLTSSMCWSPDGKHVAFVAKSKGHDTLFIVEVESGDVTNKVEIDSDGLSAPTWSPVANEVIVSATFVGQTDLVRVDLDDNSYERLTDDPDDQLTPRYFPDGQRIVFTYYPEVTIPVPETLSGDNLTVLQEMNFLDPDNVQKATYDIWEYDLRTGQSRPLVASTGDDTSPVILEDGVTMVYASDVSGVNNLHAGNIETGDYYRFTDVLGGLYTPDVCTDKNRITFSAFVKAGWDVYVSDDLEDMLSRRYKDTATEAPAVSSGDNVLDALVLTEKPGGANAPVRTIVEMTRDEPSTVDEKQDVTAGGEAGDSTLSASVEATAGIPEGDEIDIDTYEPAIRPMPVTTTVDDDGKDGRGEGRRRIEGITEAVPGEELTSLGASVSDYKTRLAPDFIGQGAGLYFSTGFGFGLSNTIAMSDMLGNHRALLAFNLYRDIEDSDILLQYYYLKRRIDYGFGLFQFKNYFNSRITSVGEAFASYQRFTERNYGLFGLVSVPFNKFYRADVELQAYVSEREFFEETDPIGDTRIFERSSTSKRRLIEPSLSFIHDSSFFSYFGPVEGSRWRITAARGVSFNGEDVSRTTAYFDYRWYKTLWYRNSIAFRALAGFSEGKDPRSFFLGGPTTLRGYDYLAFEGTRIALGSIEYRYPLLDALIFGWPGRWGFTNVGGTLFFDAGAAWDKDDVNFIRRDVNHLEFNDLQGNFGFGTYFNIGFLLLNFQFAWQTDLQTTGDHQFHFFIGPTF